MVEHMRVDRRLPRVRGQLGHALRSLRRSPWYAAGTVAVMALSLALASAVFAIVDGTLFKPLPYGDSDRVYGVALGYSSLAEDYRNLAPNSDADFVEWRRTVPDALLTAYYQDVQTIGFHDTVEARRVDAAFLNVFGVRPIVGGFAAEDFVARSKVPAALVSFDFWQRRLGGHLDVIGRRLVDDSGTGVRVAGVLPSTFVFPDDLGVAEKPDMLLPRVSANPPGNGSNLSVALRVPAGVSVAGITERLNATLAREHAARAVRNWPPNTPSRRQVTSAGYDRLRLDPIRIAVTARHRPGAIGMFAAAVTLIGLACLNIAGLAVARLRDREGDLTLRRALGARTVDLIAILAAEHLVLITIGSAVGLAGARLLVAKAVPYIQSVMALLKPPTIDLRVAGFGVLASAASVAVVTAISARGLTTPDLRTHLALTSGSTRRRRRRSAIVAIEVALGLILAVGGALVIGSLMRAWSEDPGFESRDTAIISVGSPAGQSAAQIEDFVTAISRLPGVIAAGGTSHFFLEHAFNGSEFDRPPGVPVSSLPLGIESVPVTHGFFDAAGVRLVAGRLPTDTEFETNAGVVVVSEATAADFWPGRSALGEGLVRHGRTFTVVGVVQDTKLVSLDADAQGDIFWPVAAQEQPHIGNLLVRFTKGDSESIGRVVGYIAEHCPGCWLFGAKTLHDALSTSIRGREWTGALFGAFGVAALVIVGAGILGVVAMTTNWRTREIGIRMALGATRASVMVQIVREQVTPVAAGLVAGGLVAAWATRLVTSYLYKTPTYDPSSWLVATAAIVAIAAVGALIPSRRASRVDPVQALRIE